MANLEDMKDKRNVSISKVLYSGITLHLRERKDETLELKKTNWRELKHPSTTLKLITVNDTYKDRAYAGSARQPTREQM